MTLIDSFDIISVMKLKNVFLLIVFLIVMGIPAMSIELNDFSKQLPQEIDGWALSSGEEYYASNDLFKYIDGGAELYISYEFQKVAAIKYLKGDLPEITVDIFDMGNSFNAFGVFAHSRNQVDHFISPEVESEYASGLLTFWKGKFYVSIMAYPETEAKKKIVLELGKRICDLIEEKSEKPPLISLLPAENIVTGSVRYFRHYIWLNSHFFISDKDILHINKNTQAVLAKYDDSKSKYYVLVVEYPGESEAEIARKDFLAHYLPDTVDGVKKIEDGRYTACKTVKNRIIVVFNVSSKEKAIELLNYLK